ncbi:MAG: hypothetical protein GX610_10850 [Rhodococcus sp.]|nr:hypothetical protein [Rhodococcus sp. (in: high G+C Gram-positive bacteria)]
MGTAVRRSATARGVMDVQPNAGDLDEQATAVIARWNPAGARSLAGDPGEQKFEPVHVVGPPRSGKTALIETLRDRATVGAIEFAEGPPERTQTPVVVLVVVDAAAAMGREELDLLEQVGQQAARVVFALTKTDVHHDWSAVLGRNRRVLSDHAPAYAEAPIHPVSVTGESDVEKLLAALVEEAGQMTSRPCSTVDVVEQTRQMIVTTADSMRANDPAALLRTERTELLTQRDGRRAERVARLRSEGQLAKVELLHEVAAWSRTAGVAARTEIAQADNKDLAAYPERLADTVRGAGRAIGDRAEMRLTEMSSRLGVERSVDPHTGQPYPVVEMPDDPEPRHRGLEDRMTILIGASAGLGVGRLVVSPLSMVPALDIATIPVTLLLGALAAWWLTRARAHVAERAHLRQWAADALVHVRAQFDQFVMARLVDAEAAAGEQILNQSRAHALDVDERVAAIDAEIRRTSRRRSGQLAACDRDLAALDAAVGHTEAASPEPNGGPLRLIT